MCFFVYGIFICSFFVFVALVFFVLSCLIREFYFDGYRSGFRFMVLLCLVFWVFI